GEFRADQLRKVFLSYRRPKKAYQTNEYVLSKATAFSGLTTEVRAARAALREVMLRSEIWRGSWYKSPWIIRAFSSATERLQKYGRNEAWHCAQDAVAGLVVRGALDPKDFRMIFRPYYQLFRQ